MLVDNWTKTTYYKPVFTLDTGPMRALLLVGSSQSERRYQLNFWQSNSNVGQMLTQNCRKHGVKIIF